MDKIANLILKDLEFGWNILNNSGYPRYGYKNKDELIGKLKEMKKDGLITFKECNHPLFRGEPEGKIIITNIGKKMIE